MTILSEELVLQKTRAEGLDAVRNLNLWGSDLTDVSILQRMPNVEVLSLSVNKIRSLKDFRNCHFLTELYLRKNDIQDLMEVTHLQGLSNLQILWLCDNPCVGSSASEYRKRTIAMLPNIVKLDNIDVSIKEKEEALEMYGHLTPTHTPNHTGMDVSLLGGDHLSVLSNNLRSPTLRTPTAAASAAMPTSSISILQASPGPMRESAISRAPVQPIGNGLGLNAMRMSAKAPSNVLYAVMALVKELDGDQLLAVQSEVSLRLQLLESSRP